MVEGGPGGSIYNVFMLMYIHADNTGHYSPTNRIVEDPIVV